MFYNLHFSAFVSFLLSCCVAVFFCTCMFENEREKKNSKPKCGIVCFFFLFYRDVEGVEPTAQSERVYRPENYCWRQRVWSPPKCSSFLQLVFQGPGEKVCLRFPTPLPSTFPPFSHQLLIQSGFFFIGRICVAFFPFPSLSCRCVKTLVPSTGPAAIPSSSHSNECIWKWREKTKSPPSHTHTHSSLPFLPM